jgi:hypothetical protein
MVEPTFGNGLLIGAAFVTVAWMATLALPYARRWLGHVLTGVTLDWIERKKDRIAFEQWRSIPDPTRRAIFINSLHSSLGNRRWLETLEPEEWKQLKNTMAAYETEYARRLQESE